MVNQRQLNGGQQGSGSGLDADMVDSIESSNLQSELGKNVSLNEYRTSLNALFYRVDYNRFQHGLQSLGYPDGFYDYFRDESKIASSSNLNITTGTNGKVELSGGQSTESTYLNYSSYVGTGSISFTGEALQNNITLSSVTVFAFSGVSSIDVTVNNSSGQTIAQKSKNLSSADRDVTIDISRSEYSSFLSNESYEVILSASGGNLSPSSDSTDYSGSLFSIDSNQDAPGVEGTNDNIEFAQVSFNTSGSFTSIVFDKGYQTTKWTPTIDYTLNGQSISKVELLDGSDGSVIKSINESEIGDTIPVSTNATTYQQRVELSGDGTDTPVINHYESGLDD